VRTVLKQIVRCLGVLAGVLAVGCAGLYALAILALHDMPQQSLASASSALAGNSAVAVDAGHRPLLSYALTEHDGNAASAHLLQGGRAMLSSSSDGTTRLSSDGATSVILAATAPTLRDVVYARLWQPFLAPIANWAIWPVAQVLPLSIPEARKGRRGYVFRDCDTCPEMVEIEPGLLLMGSALTESGHLSEEAPRNLVSLPQRFAVGRFEVTRAEFSAFAAATGAVAAADDKCQSESEPGKSDWEDRAGRNWRSPGFPQGDTHPVVCVSWTQAKAYAAWLSERTGQSYRLLTEAEWEFAARAGSTTRYAFGDADSDLCSHGNGRDQTARRLYGGAGLPRSSECDDRYIHTSPVGNFRPNAFGLHDMHGNAWEWVEDCWLDDYKSASLDGSARVSEACRLRVFRGGAWNSGPNSLRSANRGGTSPERPSNVVGFRVARNLDR
jgi:formylglycine-generating enzyme required for sulfatase activity